MASDEVDRLQTARWCKDFQQNTPEQIEEIFTRVVDSRS
jgi:hypothetical protein